MIVFYRLLVSRRSLARAVMVASCLGAFLCTASCAYRTANESTVPLPDSLDTAHAHRELAAFAWQKDAQWDAAYQSMAEALEGPEEEDVLDAEAALNQALQKDLAVYWYSDHLLDLQPSNQRVSQDKVYPSYFQSDVPTFDAEAVNAEPSDANLLFYSGPFLHQNRQTAGIMHMPQCGAIKMPNMSGQQGLIQKPIKAYCMPAHAEPIKENTSL